MSRVLAFIAVVALCTPAFALPALQLGPGGLGSWFYLPGTQTWATNTNPFEVKAYANAVIGGNGSYAWQTAPDPTQNAYLVLAGVPSTVGDAFDVTVKNDGATLSLFDSGFGTPPVEDPNSLAPHGIFSTWFEIYEFQFDGSAMLIGDQQPGGTGTGQGYMEAFEISINALNFGATGVHMDLFTVSGNGSYTPGDPSNRKLVNAFAPFSHDAEYVPEPMSLAVWSMLGTFCALVWVWKGKGEQVVRAAF